MSKRILRIDASARYSDSKSRGFTDKLIKKMSSEEGDAFVTVRDLAQGLPYVCKDWIAAKSKSVQDYTPQEKTAMQLSDVLIKELKDNECIIISCPIYNFTIPAVLKAWIDLVACPGKTFQYEGGEFEGLLTNKSAVIIFASSTTQIGSPQDHASDYMRDFLNFIGISDIQVKHTS